MSTAGKVLVVLVTLATLVYIVLISMVARLYSNSGSKIDDQQKQVAKLQDQLPAEEANLAELRRSIDRELMLLDQEVTTLRIQKADADKLLTTTLETLSRYDLQRQGAEAAYKDIQAALKRRTQEKNDAFKELAETKSQVAKTKAENAELLAQLTKLREDFQTTLAENKDMVRRILEAGQRRTRQASNTR